MKIETMGFEGTEQIDALIKLLEKISKIEIKRICKEAVREGSNIVFEEEKRKVGEMGERGSEYTNMLRSYQYFVRKHGYSARCGYDTETIENHIEILIMEFGRPGTGRKALQRHGIDKIGRRIGVIQPAANIRRAWFATSQEVKHFLGNYVYNELKKAWVKKNGK